LKLTVSSFQDEDQISRTISFLFSLVNFTFIHEVTMGCVQSSQQAALVQSIQEALGNDSELYAFPGDPLYKLEDVKVYNLSIPVKPSAVTYPKTSAQVAAIIKCAVEAGLKVQPRSGGHSYANYCTLSYSQITRQKRLQ
jgi:hypothetical protein